MSAGSKSRLAKAAGAEVAAQSRQEKWHAAVARSTFQVRMLKNLHCRSIFGPWAVENLHAALARSTFASQNVKNMRCSGHFWTCGCRKMVEKWHAAVAPSTFASQNVQNTCVLHHF